MKTREIEVTTMDGRTCTITVPIKAEKCPSCGDDFNEFPEMRHQLDECPGPDCTCYEIIGGHQPMCPYGVSLIGKKVRRTE